MTEGKGWARRVTLANLENFSPLLRRPGQPAAEEEDEEAAEPTQEEKAGLGEFAKALTLFGGKSIKARLPYPAAKRTRSQRGQPAPLPNVVVGPIASAPAPQSPKVVVPAGSAAVAVPAAATVPVAPQRGNLVWQKTGLPASDVQRQTGNPTGGVRLTQAGFRVNGALIDKTSYFRRSLFGKYPWTVKRVQPQVVHTIVPMHVILLATSYGRRDIEISDKPSGQAGQSNYTSMLHWGDLGDIVHDLNLGGRTLLLYAPALSNGPFTLEVQ